MTDLTSLIERIEMAEGPSRGLDAEISAVLEPHLFDAPGFTPVRPIPGFRFDKAESVIRFEGGGLMDVRFFPPVTSSVDAALALVQRVHPGWGGLLSLGSGASIHVADLWSERRGNQSSEDEDENPMPPGEDAQAEHASLPIAIVLATLRALQQKGTGA